MYTRREVIVDKTLRRPPETATGSVLQNKGVLKNFSVFTRKHLCCEYCVIYKNTFFEEHLRMAVSIGRYLNVLWTLNLNHVFTGIKPLCSKTVFNKNPYYVETNQMTHIVLKMKQNPTSDFQRCATLIQRYTMSKQPCTTLIQSCINVVST